MLSAAVVIRVKGLNLMYYNFHSVNPDQMLHSVASDLDRHSGL